MFFKVNTGRRITQDPAMNALTPLGSAAPYEEHMFDEALLMGFISPEVGSLKEYTKNF
jgi:hypothetical protein